MGRRYTVNEAINFTDQDVPDILWVQRYQKFSLGNGGGTFVALSEEARKWFNHNIGKPVSVFAIGSVVCLKDLVVSMLVSNLIVRVVYRADYYDVQLDAEKNDFAFVGRR